MAFDSGGTLFVGTDQDLNSVDTATGAGTGIGGFTFTGFVVTPGTSHQIVAMATHPSDGTVFGFLKRTGSGSTTNHVSPAHVNVDRAVDGRTGPDVG